MIDRFELFADLSHHDKTTVTLHFRGQSISLSYNEAAALAGQLYSAGNQSVSHDRRLRDEFVRLRRSLLV